MKKVFADDFFSVVSASGMMDMFTDKTQNLTLFAPTNAAINKLGHTILHKMQNGDPCLKSKLISGNKVKVELLFSFFKYFLGDFITLYFFRNSPTSHFAPDILLLHCVQARPSEKCGS